MKNLSPRNIAFITSLVTTFIESLFFIIYPLINKFEFNFYTLLFVFVFNLILNFFIFQMVLKYFIYDKVKLIYKKIRNEKIGKLSSENRGTIDSKIDIISEVNKDVENWLTYKQKEISDLKNIEKYRKEFLGNVSHELKTPIFNIQGYILTLLDGGIDDPSINLKYLQKTENSINRMISIVEDLENISKIEHGQLVLELKKIDISLQVKEVIESIDEYAKQKNIRLINNNFNKSYYTIADSKRIKQVLVNLISNAINYNKENGKVTIDYFDMDDHILIEVTDNGIGIEQKHIPRLFERFYRVDKSRSTKYGGTGLGLSIVKHIIEAHNESINVRSTIGVGTTFAFTLKKA